MHPAEQVKRNCPLALMTPAGDLGFYVQDTRTGHPLGFYEDIRDAAALTSHLNALYPTAPWPAYDTLKWELEREGRV